MEWVILAIIVAVVLYAAVSYNGLVSLRQRVTQAFADIDVQLKQRHDLIPNLVETVKGYAGHERGSVDNPRSGFADLFATHPAIEDRIEALVRYAGGHAPERATLAATAPPQPGHGARSPS